jgi:glutamine amidotransferase
MIALVDYGMGNLRSVEKALARVGADVRIVNTRADVSTADALVVPGVGAFGDCMRNLTRLDLVEPIREFITSKRPFLGICLGFQALFQSSQEAPRVKGLAVFEGTVPRFAANGIKVPHMGWNRLKIRLEKCPLLQGVDDSSYMYFVHSYYCAPKNDEFICGTTDYGVEFCAMLWSGNVYATQFHPEKSQAVGLRMLQNFVKLAEAKG